MHLPRTRRPRIAAAVTAVLAVTAGTALAAAPAVAAAPAAAVSAAAEQARVFDVPVGTEIMGAGPNGILAGIPHHVESIVEYEYRWYRPDGTFTVLTEAWSSQEVHRNAAASDIVTISGSGGLQLRDMAAPSSDPVVIKLSELEKPGVTYSYLATIGSTLLVEVRQTGAPKEFHLVSRAGGTLSDRKITGLPAGIDTVQVDHGVRATADAAVVSYRTGASSGLPRRGVVTVDLATATAGTDHPLPDTHLGADTTAIDAQHVAWWQDATTLVVADRATGAEQRLAPGRAGWPVVGLLGSWVVTANPSEVGYGQAGDPMTALRALPVSGGEPVKLLDRMSSLTPAADGTLLVRGGTVEHGEGIYRIAVGADGRPTAELVASTGEQTALTLVRTDFGPVVDLDAMNGRARLGWTLSHGGYAYEVKLTHKQTRRTYTYALSSNYAGSFTFLWRGNYGSGENAGEPAHNGDYTWELKAKPSNGIGPDLSATGEFTVKRGPKLHDYGNNGSPDLFARDSYGNLLRFDTTYDAWKAKVLPVGSWYTAQGWNTYNRMESVGDVAGTGIADVVTRDTSGVLWLHQGTGDERVPLAPRVRVGAGWQIYDKLTGGSDLTGDGRPDLLATDPSGGLYLYKATGNAAAPFAPRKKIGTGWNIYNRVVAVGNLAGAAAGDLVARDKDGVLWLYLGKGDGTYTERTKIGAGWNQYSSFVAVGDANMDGRNDLYVYGPNNTSYLYGGTGSWRTPFQTRVPSDLFINTNNRYNYLF